MPSIHPGIILGIHVSGGLDHSEIISISLVITLSSLNCRNEYKIYSKHMPMELISKNQECRIPQIGMANELSYH